MKFNKVLVSLVIPLSLTACGPDANNQDVGVIAGSIVGGIIGSQVGDGEGRVAATAVGAVAGSIIGGNIGASMDELNRMKMSEALEDTKTNHSRSWVDPDNNAKYTVKPTKTVYEKDTVCRNFTMSVVIDGKLETASGVACRGENGGWDIVK